LSAQNSTQELTKAPGASSHHRFLVISLREIPLIIYKYIIIYLYYMHNI